ncbi:MAG: glutamine--tRNA ligase/YqeY domain fusion protein [Acidobacteriota bacterium]
MSDETTTPEAESEATERRHFIQQAIDEDLRSGRFERVQTRFPPEPNGHLHVGHAKAICLNFALAEEYGGVCKLRFDDTNPSREKQEYVDAMMRDIRWLGFEWDGEPCHASDYFQQLHDWAIVLIEKGLAYVCDLSPDEMREHRGTLTEAGKNSPHRDRSVEENLDLFALMRAGEFEDGSRTLRAKIDMSSPNINLRDPVMYRIQKVTHQRTGDEWPIYPTYDWAHGQSDSIEGVTFSLCSQEFENNRPLYDWYLDQLGVHHPRQIESARLSLATIFLSKRKLIQLVDEGHVESWDDPRMPTLSGMRRRGYTPEAIRSFIKTAGVSKSESRHELVQLENALREHQNRWAERRYCVLKPLKVVITNYPEGQTEELEAINNPEDPDAGTRTLPFSREIYIERTDFMEDPPRKFFRLAPDREVRLRYAYFIRCEEVIKDESGEVVELRCTYDPETRGGNAPDGRKVKGTIHWVDAAQSVPAELRLFEPLFSIDGPEQLGEGEDLFDHINPKSREVLTGCLVEPSLGDAAPGSLWQFERHGYFCADPDGKPGAPVFNRSVSLRDSWAKIQAKGGGKGGGKGRK